MLQALCFIHVNLEITIRSRSQALVSLAAGALVDVRRDLVRLQQLVQRHHRVARHESGRRGTGLRRKSAQARAWGDRARRGNIGAA